ncbi:Lin1244/Lin1753 domain-containing protein [Clostridium sp. Cult3]|uniref:Lin1244/Lin1753 domain-containing protein n=1 Tax=Clostridium sp. Cult3 TaxID=2079004 RepID=UPI001F1F3CC0|nr:Lin1244/Lin1753 domain-containing protein [Clostridium sp. Cult3]MCF6461471.1 DNA replication protein DnaD [Clostridium sp. Cult3]
MARPQKVGVDYFPLDVDIDQDDKVAIIEAQHGIIGFGIIVKLLMHIYKNSYYYEWTEKEQILFSRRVNVDINQVNVIINDCVKWGLFDEKLFKEFKILTSRGVQKRYFEIVKRRQRVEVAKEFLLLDNVDINSYSNLVIVSINEEVEGVNVDINPQSKVKESKEYSSSNIEPVEEKNQNDISLIANEFEQNGFGTINFAVKEMIIDLLNEYSTEWIQEAIKVAVKNNKRKLSYVEGILQNWRRDGGMKLGGGSSGTNKRDNGEDLGQYGDIGITI